MFTFIDNFVSKNAFLEIFSQAERENCEKFVIKQLDLSQTIKFIA